jgi:hypothetical protein
MRSSGVKHAMKVAGISACVVLATGCGNWRDQGMIDAARGLVPPETSETSWSDTEGQYAMLTGDYEVNVHFDDGDQLGPDAVVDAVARRASEQGWVERLRCERPGAWIVYYTRDNLKGRFRVPKPPLEDDNSVLLQRIGDGNEWPPDDCEQSGDAADLLAEVRIAQEKIAAIAAWSADGPDESANAPRFVTN